MKLRTKIPLLLIPLIVLPLLVLGWIAYSQLRETYEQRMFGEMQADLEHFRSHMDETLEAAYGNLDLLARHTLVRKYIMTEDEDERYSLLQAPLLRLFSAYQQAFPQYYEMRVFLPDGYEDVRQTRPYIENLSDEEGDSAFFRAMQVQGDQLYSGIFQNPDNRQTSLFLGKPLILTNRTVDPVDVQPRLRGYVGLTIDISELEAHIHNDSIGDSGYLFATDRTGNIVFEPDTVSLNGTLPAGIVEYARVSNAEQRPQTMMIGAATSLVSGIRLHRDLYLFAVLPEHEMQALIYQLAAVVAAITLFTILITMVCLVMALEHLVIKPIHTLGSISREIGRGNLDIDSGVDSDDEIGELAVAFEDMAKNLRQSNEQISYLAYHDSLTGLPNRSMFKEYLGKAIAHAKRNQKQLALLFLDLDDFKRVNDTLGHHAGDGLLQEIGDRLMSELREEDYMARADALEKPGTMLARLGGDEFIILLTDIKHPNDPAAVAQRLIRKLTQTITIDVHEHHISTSIGITLYPGDGEAADDLIKNADIAMYHAKERGKNGFQLFQDDMNAAAMERMALEGMLRNALRDDHLCLHYQPQVNAISGEIVGLEALLRWNDPERGLIPPNAFIGVAEDSGLIMPIGEWVAIEACRQVRAWQLAGYFHGRVSINISSIQFARQDILSILHKALQESGLEPRHLEIEITESAIMSQPERTVQILEEIKALGVSVALDDFGTGYSSLSYLRRFPIDTLKIDRSFIVNIDTNPEDAEIVAAIAAMAHTLKLQVVVEGIETESQLRSVVSRGGDVIQGYLFSRPLPANEIPVLLASGILKIA